MAYTVYVDQQGFSHSHSGAENEQYGLDGSDTLEVSDLFKAYILDGGTGSDFLIAGAENDELYGGEGSDFCAGHGGDDLIYGGEGSDSLAGEEFTGPSAGVAGDDIIYGGGGNDLIVGNGGDDFLSGDAGKDSLLGGTGRDTLFGGAGKDTFAFNTKASKNNVDRIVDFSGSDLIGLDDAVFSVGPTGDLAAKRFFAGAHAHDANDRIIYNAATGSLIYDSNGDGAGHEVVFAKLTKGLHLTADDFTIF